MTIHTKKKQRANNFRMRFGYAFLVRYTTTTSTAIMESNINQNQNSVVRYFYRERERELIGVRRWMSTFWSSSSLLSVIGHDVEHVHDD